jgi:hemolysin activation/secretion protein
VENRIENKRKKVVFVLTVCWAVFVCVCAPAFAQDVPTSVDPSRRTESLERSAAPEIESLRLPAPAAAFDVAVPEGAEAYSFVLTDLQVRGVSVYRPEKIQRIYQDKIGQSISVADIYTIAGKITQRYRDDGFLLAQAIIPPQEIDKGVVIIEVNEGTIARVAYEGFEDGEVPFFARGVAQRIEQISPFNVHFLERQLLLLNRATGYQAVGILEPLPPEEAAPGAVGLKILMADAASAYSASMDNYGSNYVGPWQVGGQARIGHTGLLNGVTDMSLFTSPQVKEIGYASLGETMLLTSDGLSLNTAVKYSRSEPGGSLRELELKSRFLSVAMELEYPVFLSRSYELNLFGGFELKIQKAVFWVPVFMMTVCALFMPAYAARTAMCSADLCSGRLNSHKGLIFLVHAKRDRSTCPGRRDAAIFLKLKCVQRTWRALRIIST